MPHADAPAAAWIPGRGPDPDALARMRERLRRPHEPMAAASAAGGTPRMFPDLLDELDGVAHELLHDALWEAAAGTCRFGRRPGWDAWLLYLIAQLVPRARQRFTAGRVSELLVTAFVALYPQGVADAPYPGFQDDVLRTLGQSLMEPAAWPAPVGSAWREPRAVTALGYYDLQADVAALAFLQAKYLPASEVPAWVGSVLDIPAPAWRANTLAWLVWLHPLLSGAVQQVDALSRDGYGTLAWHGSDCLHGREDGNPAPAPAPAAIPPANGAAVIATVRRRMTVARLVQWLDSFEANPALENGLLDLPERFTALYLD